MKTPNVQRLIQEMETHNLLATKAPWKKDYTIYYDEEHQCDVDLAEYMVEGNPQNQAFIIFARNNMRRMAAVIAHQAEALLQIKQECGGYHPELQKYADSGESIPAHVSENVLHYMRARAKNVIETVEIICEKENYDADTGEAPEIARGTMDEGQRLRGGDAPTSC